jgi:hypothetical protein
LRGDVCDLARFDDSPAAREVKIAEPEFPLREMARTYGRAFEQAGRRWKAYLAGGTISLALGVTLIATGNAALFLV